MLLAIFLCISLAMAYKSLLLIERGEVGIVENVRLSLRAEKMLT